MRRRELLVGIGAAAVMPPLAVPAQQLKKLPRIGFLATGRFQGRMIDAFMQGLGELGYAEGTNFTLEYRQAESKVERFPALAKELVDLKVDLIVATNSLAARAAQQATSTIPIIVPVMGDPVSDGLVGSLARPGNNITGLTFLGPELLPKRLALLKEALPAVSRIAALWHPGAYGEPTMNDMPKPGRVASTCRWNSRRYTDRTSSTERSRTSSERAPMPSLSFRARCSSPSCDVSPSLPAKITYRRWRWRGSSPNSAVSWPMERASPTCIGAPLSTSTRF